MQSTGNYLNISDFDNVPQRYRQLFVVSTQTDEFDKDDELVLAKIKKDIIFNF